MKIREKLIACTAAQKLRNGKILAHNTATVAGVVACIDTASGIHRLQRFKQRPGPFLLLAASTSDALRLSRVRSNTLKKLAHYHWPGPVTLVFPARSGLPQACYHHGTVAVRVDASSEVRQLARCMGGLLLSSSLNRRGKKGRPATRHSHLHFSSWISGRVQSISTKPNGKASAIFIIKGSRVKQLR